MTQPALLARLDALLLTVAPNPGTVPTAQRERDRAMLEVMRELVQRVEDVEAMRVERQPARCIRFTRRENDVLAAIEAGHTSGDQIAQRLCIAKSTVNTHLYRMFSKTGTKSKTTLVLWAMGQRG